MDFDLQSYLSDWRKENREDSAAMMTAFKAHEESDTKQFASVTESMAPLIMTHQNLKWAIRGVIAASAAFLFDLFVNHLPILVAIFKK